ncbi:MAG: 2OG-Fe(II) oxygenase family protein, partial [Phenylobacterium sp.]|nr:2OG-Fe(II) oxygenase family protein [Phenylobacterium sp.]
RPGAVSSAIRLNRRLDPAALASVFARHGRIHVPQVLDAASARVVGQAIASGEVPWTRSVTVNGNPYDIGLPTLAAMPPERAAQFRAAVDEAARAGFQYEFDAWRLSDVVEAGERRGGPLAALEAVYDLVNSEAFLGFVRAMTGDPHAVYADAQATRYTAGHFLTAHDDAVEGKNRLFAYVLNFTPVWRADWGGLLLFHDADGHVSEGYTPTFNALNIFRVPQAHAVSQVASFVTASRYSITGWIRSRRG